MKKESQALKCFLILAVSTFFLLAYVHAARAQARPADRVTAARPAKPSTSSSSSSSSTQSQVRRRRIDLIGSWVGTFDGQSARLNIFSVTGNTFQALLIQQGFEIGITGKMSPGQRRVTLQETRIIKKPRDSIWTLGINTGTFGTNYLSMSGSGSDGNKRYTWYFNRR